MSVRVDPERIELNKLLAYTGPLAGTSVLEVGCGDGRLTFRYASRAGRVVAIDPDPDKIARAHFELPSDLAARVTFHAADVLDFAGSEAFDLAIFSWSL